VTRTRHDLRLATPDVCERRARGLLAITSTTIIETHKQTLSILSSTPCLCVLTFSTHHSLWPPGMSNYKLPGHFLQVVRRRIVH
jgi:hypothetical protein